MNFEKFLLFCAFDQSLPLFLGDVQSAWGAEQPQHRLLLKKAAQGSVYFSVSHCPVMGGFVGLTPEHPLSLQVGFDLEEVERVNATTADRVGNPKDHGFASSTASLRWSAREAAFKALQGPCQPQVISQIALTDWRPREHEIVQFQFAATGTSPGLGYAWSDGEIQFALTLWTPDSQFEKGCRSS